MDYNFGKSETTEPEDAIRPYVSDNTTFMRWSTEMEHIHDLIDSGFLARHRERVIDINKFLPLANITSHESNALFRLRRLNIDLSVDANLRDLAETTTLDNISDYQTTRGQDGFFQTSLITQRREWRDSSAANKNKGILGRMFGRAEQEGTMRESLQE